MRLGTTYSLGEQIKALSPPLDFKFLITVRDSDDLLSVLDLQLDSEDDLDQLIEEVRERAARMVKVPFFG